MGPVLNSEERRKADEAGPTRVVHFGVGNFFRAHAAIYFEAAGFDVHGVALKSET